jgi:hypothetical protein
MGIVIGLPVNRKEVIYARQDKWSGFFPKDIPQSLINLLEVSQNIVFRILHSPSVAVKDCGPFSARSWRPGVELELPLGVIPFKGIAQASWNALQLNLRWAVSGAMEESHFVLTERQNVELSLMAEKGKQGLDVKPVGDDQQFIKLEGQTIVI